MEYEQDTSDRDPVNPIEENLKERPGSDSEDRVDNRYSVRVPQHSHTFAGKRGKEMEHSPSTVDLLNSSLRKSQPQPETNDSQKSAN